MYVIYAKKKKKQQNISKDLILCSPEENQIGLELGEGDKINWCMFEDMLVIFAKIHGEMNGEILKSQSLVTY